jgi:hypothetical protein
MVLILVLVLIQAPAAGGGQTKFQRKRRSHRGVGRSRYDLREWRAIVGLWPLDAGARGVEMNSYKRQVRPFL